MSDETKQQSKIQVEIPAGLQELATIGKDTVYAEKLVEHYRADMERALAYELISGPPLAFGPFLAAVKEDVGNNPKLAAAVRASPGSLISALLYAAQCKLLPGGAYKQLYLIPRNMRRKRGNDWQSLPEVTRMLGYHGICTMMQRCPRVHSVQAFCVYDGEEFDYEPGAGRIHHKWSPKVERVDDAIVLAYAKVVITEPNSTRPVENQPIVWPMTRKEILAIRDRSDAYTSAEKSWNGKPPAKDSPWHTDFAAMCRKTPLRAIGSNGSVPLDMGTGGALSADAAADAEKDDGPLPAPKATQSANIRGVLGLDRPPPRFEFVEQATQAIAEAKTRQELESLARGWEHFPEGGADAETIAIAYQDRLGELGQ